MKDDHSIIETANRRNRTKCDGFRERGAAVCVKDESENEILLVTSKRDETKWVIPGGGVEFGEDVSEAASREAMEEAGVKGSITRFLGVFEAARDRRRTSVFVMRVTEELHDWDDARRLGRKRCWFPIDEARSLLGLHKQSQQIYLDRMKRSTSGSDSIVNDCAGAGEEAEDKERDSAATKDDANISSSDNR